MHSGRLVFVTGISGTGVRLSLQKYKEWCKRNGHSEPQVLSLEDDFIVPEAAPYASKLGGVPKQDVDIIELLTLPKPLLAKLWRDAFDKAIDAITESRAQGRDCILTFHAVWYHLGNREYLSCVDFKSLTRDEAQADIVISLLDDIYDVLTRLSVPRGIFSIPA